MLRKIRHLIRCISSIPSIRGELAALQSELAYVREGVGRLERRQTVDLKSPCLADHEFRVFSQWGQDGIIQYLIRHVGVKSKTFVEFGVESYREASTRFLLVNDNWRGLVMDGGQANIDYVKSTELYWRYNLTAVCTFVTPSNINSLLRDNGFSGEIGVLVVDIDGQDYWVWKNITAVSPAIVIVEYNFRFGPDRAVTVPLDESFVRTKAHYSNLYYGASAAALIKLGKEKGYSCVGCNSSGNDVYFVRDDLMPAGWKGFSSQEAYVSAQFREHRDEKGRLVFSTEQTQRELVETLPLVEV